MPELLSTGVSALSAYQRSLTTVSHNIANVNTDSYSRQRTELGTRPPQFTGAGFLGNGITTTGTVRLQSELLVTSVRENTADYTRLEEFAEFSMRLDNLLADEQAGLNPALESFFNAAQDVASDPASIPARQVMLSEASNLASRFDFIEERMQDIDREINRQIEFYTSEINTLAQSIAEINQDIKVYSSQGTGNMPNDLLDERDRLLTDLSELVGVQTIIQDDNSMNVFIGTGQALVIGGVANGIGSINNEYLATDKDVVFVSQAGSQNITSSITGGRLGGILDFRSQVLEEARIELGRVAQGFTEAFNDQHRLGMDLDDNLGTDFFTLDNPQVLQSSNNTGGTSISATLSDANQLSPSNYRIRFNGVDWIATRLSDNTSTNFGAAPGTVTLDGVDITFTAPGAANPGDAFLLRPSAAVSGTVSVNITDVNDIAAASPIVSQKSIANTGSAVISAGVMVDETNAAFTTTPQTLTPPILIRFTAANTYSVYDNTNPGAPVLLEGGIAYNPATGGTVFPTPGALDYGYRVDISGAAAVGDEFTVGYNNGGVGDNRNMLVLADLQRANVLDNGNSTISQSYIRMVAAVGSDTRRAEIDRDAQAQLLQQAEDQRQSVSGVNLDEEAADLIKFQQAYQASARIISVAQTIFDTLIASV